MDQLKIEMRKCLKTLPDEEMSVRVHMSTPYIFTGIHVSKDIKRSEKVRNEGNSLFLQKSHDSQTHHKILHLYNESIAYAPSDSEELARAYGNKSAILRHIRKYILSIKEADKAIKITSSITLKVKLICRKAENWAAIGSPRKEECLEEARCLLAKEDIPENLKDTLQDLINKSQLVVDAGELDRDKAFIKKMLVQVMIEGAEKKNVWDSVKIEFSEKYGRHLVAIRDLLPGETITVEKSFLTKLLDSKIFMYCYHCFEYLWNVVPCEKCAFRLYCSEECKDEAWNQHHDIECDVLVKMKEGALLDAYNQMPLIVSFFFKAYKEAGSIEQLQEDLEELDRSDVDEKSKKFPADSKSTSYKSMYLLRSRHFIEDERNKVIRSAAIALLSIAKYTDILGTRYDFKDIKKLRRNDTAIFVGALLFKFAWVIHSRVTFSRLIDPSDPNRQQMLETPMCESLKSLGYLFPLVCAPNCKSAVTDGAKHLTYALQPIKAGTMLTTSIASIYDHCKKAKRLETIKQFYNCVCDCRACTENWFDPEPTRDQIKMEIAPTAPIGINLLSEVEDICREMMKKSLEEMTSDQMLMLRTAFMVAIAWKHFSMPSTVLLRTTSMLQRVYDMYYTSVLLHSHPCNQ